MSAEEVDRGWNDSERELFSFVDRFNSDSVSVSCKGVNSGALPNVKRFYNSLTR